MNFGDVPRWESVRPSCNAGRALSLDTGPYDAKDEQLAAGQLHLYGRAKLAAGARYRLTWACWPVGAKEATELSCEFEVAR